MLQVHKDFSELPFSIDISSLIEVSEDMPITHIKLYSLDAQREVLKPFLADILRPRIDKTITIEPTLATEFEGEHLIVDVWGCSKPSAPDLFDWSNLELKKHTFTAVNLTLYNCSPQVISPTFASPYVIEIQKN